MARGNKNGRGTPSRGGGGFRGGGRGGRGGRGSQGNGRGNGRGRGSGRANYISMDEIDYQIQQYSEGQAEYSNNGPNRGSGTPRSRGRGGGSGYSTPRGRGRGGESSSYFSQRGRGSKRHPNFNGNAPLSKLLYEDRPFLKPIVFVRSVHTATLFEEEEDIIKATVEPEAESSHVPTADKVARIFGEAADDDPESEELEEIDFSEIGRMQAEVDAVAATLPPTTNGDVKMVEERFTGFYIDSNPSPVPAPVLSEPQTRSSNHAGSILGIPEADDEEIVYVAPHPRAGPVTPPTEEVTFGTLPTVSILTGLVSSSEPPELSVEVGAIQPEGALLNNVVEGAEASSVVDSTSVNNTTNHPTETASADLFVVDTKPNTTFEAEVDESPDAGEQRSDTGSVVPAPNSQEESSIHVARISSPSPLPSSATGSHQLASSVSAPTFDSFSFTKLSTPSKKLERKIHPVHTPKSLLNKSRVRSTRKLHHFGSYGALLSEAHLRDEASGTAKDPRRNEQRRGDSDVDWGDGSDADEAVEEISNGLGGMELDEDLDLNAMASFVKSMGVEGSRHLSMDDIEDIQRIKEEDEDNGGESSEDDDDEMEGVFRRQEELLVGEDTKGDEDEDEDEDEEEEEDSSEDDGDGPSGSFQARLNRLRNAQGKRPIKVDEDSEDDDDDLEMALDQSWADKDEEFLAHIQSFVDEGQEILSRKERKQRDRIFNSIRNGSWQYDEYEELVSRPANRGKNKDVPFALQEQWENDRKKKAENKAKRALERLKLAADPMVRKKGGKKGMKDSLAAARYAQELPNQVNSLISLEQQIRRFLADLGGPQSMALPPADKNTRKRVHELAGAFNLKSQSKGKGSGRYTTLIKTTRSGIQINEGKVRRILREVDPSWQGPDRRGRGQISSLAKHKEGEEVGKAAPKIGESNIGFQMLAAMGWTEGDRIGLSGGLDAPLVAVMKKTKLGLGATMSNQDR